VRVATVRVPTVTVVIAARNAASTLDAQLDALEGQTFDAPFDVVIVDNGSTDATAELVAARSGGPVEMRRILASDGRGPAYARNVGVEHSDGELLAFCDADDIVSSAWLESLAEAAEGVDAVAGPLRFASSLNSPEALAWYGYRADGLSATGTRVTGGLLPHAAGANLAIWRRTLAALGGFDEDAVCVEDKEISWRLQLAGYELGFAPGAVVDYRLRGSLGEFARQQFQYGRMEPLLYRSFHRDGLTRRPVAVVARSWLSTLLTAPTIIEPRRRGRWVRRIARDAGRLRGSVDQRCWVL
jgi:glycosyltransferase involved in cell wall biosynthesis